MKQPRACYWSTMAGRGRERMILIQDEFCENCVKDIDCSDCGKIKGNMEKLTIKHLAAIMLGLLSGNVRIWHPEYELCRLRGIHDTAIYTDCPLGNAIFFESDLPDCYLVGKGWQDLVQEVDELPDVDQDWRLWDADGECWGPLTLDAGIDLIEAGYNPGIVPGHLWKGESEVKTETA